MKRMKDKSSCDVKNTVKVRYTKGREVKGRSGVIMRDGEFLPHQHGNRFSASD